MKSLLTNALRRGFFPGAVALGLALGANSALAASGDLPKDSEALVETIREAIEARDYERFKELVFWKDAGKIKERVVAFQIRRGLGRPIRSVTFEPFPADGLKAHEDSGKLMVNMPVTNRVRVVYDEEPIDATGKLPTSVFLVGKVDDAYRIGLVVRKPDAFDDDD